MINIFLSFIALRSDSQKAWNSFWLRPFAACVGVWHEARQ